MSKDGNAWRGKIEETLVQGSIMNMDLLENQPMAFDIVHFSHWLSLYLIGEIHKSWYCGSVGSVNIHDPGDMGLLFTAVAALD